MEHKLKKTVSKSAFARMCNVSPAAITKASKTILKDCLVKGKIDLDHPQAKKYLNTSEPISSVKGVEPLYEKAIEACKISGRYSARFLRDTFNIGKPKADKIIETMKINNIIPDEKDIKSTGNKVIIETVPRTKKTFKKEESKEDKIIEVPEDIQDFADMPLRELIDRFGTDARFCDWLKATKDIEIINEKRLKNAITQGDLVSQVLVKKGVIDPVDTCLRRLLSDCSRTLSVRVPAMHDAGETPEKIESFIADQMTSFIRPMKDKIARFIKEYSG